MEWNGKKYVRVDVNLGRRSWSERPCCVCGWTYEDDLAAGGLAQVVRSKTAVFFFSLC